MELLVQGASFLAGAALAWSLAAPPGPGNAMMAHEAARRSWGAGVLTGLGAVAADLCMFLLMWMGILRLVGGRAWIEVALAVAGAALMTHFAWGAWKAARSPLEERVGSFWRAFATIVTSPFNWGWWLTVGATLFADLGIVLMIGFFAGLVLWVFAWCGLARLGATYFARFAHWVAYASAAVLLLFAGIVGWYAVQRTASLFS